VRKVLSSFLGAVLLLALGFELTARCFFAPVAAVDQSVEQSVPSNIPGWTVHTLPIAETEIMQQQVKEVLHYDEAVYRVYRRGGLEVAVYAAYWKPGSANYSRVGVHTPDTCWIYNGWTRNQRDHAVPLAVGARPMLPAETGTFSKNGAPLHVMFWHLVGGRPVSYDETGWDRTWRGKLHRLQLGLADFARFGLRQRDDQCFVRVTSSRPLREALDDPHFQSLLWHLEPLGVFAAKKTVATQYHTVP
jgi:hypothetical protein